MLIKLTVLQLQVNLPIQDCDVFFLLDNKNKLNSLPEGLIYERVEEYVLMPQITDIHIIDWNFVVKVQNPEDQIIIVIHAIAMTSSSSKVKLLGSSEIDLGNLFGLNPHNKQLLTLRQQLKGVQNQKGNVTFELGIVPQNGCISFENRKLSQSFEKCQASSSDSYGVNLKELTFAQKSQNHTQIPDSLSHVLENYQTSVSSQEIIPEEIDLQDFEDQVNASFEQANNAGWNFQSGKKIQPQNGENSCNKSQLDSQGRSGFFLQEKLKIAKYLHRLQQSDFSALRVEEKLTTYLE